MNLQDRDINIINYLEEFKGATIDQVATLFFKGSYEAAKKRLKILENSKHIKGDMHEVLGKKVYFISKLTSYHRIITNDIRIELLQHVEVIDFKFEAKINNFKVDALCVYKVSDLVKILIVEVDIYNRTTDKKILIVENEIKNKIGIAPRTIIFSLHKRAERGGEKRNIEIKKMKKELVKYI